MRPFTGFLLVDKPADMSSFGVVARVRRQLSQRAGKKVKVGHTGTLDPFATGLMIIVVGDYCKRAAEFSKLGKTYEVTLRLGQTSRTGDPEGELRDVSARIPSRQELEAALVQFRGTIDQTPPAFSAIKINGQRAYKLARAGKEVVMPIRQVTVHHLELVNYAYPEAQIVCDVSSGFYIRSLVRDIGDTLGVGAYTTALRRTKVGEWEIARAVDIEATDFAERLTLLG
ncbi:MAG TPA: tRNA pseudouridine(55) synthase TruB [Magnetospirillaceae bacterium]|nr:tRNA pseudouridine(55) synthase TruB [Magnetospirillaceae bacterium]